MGLPEHCSLKLRQKYQKGQKNLITDVPGVTVGHSTIKEGIINTGVTAIFPHQENVFKEKVVASSAVLNGFGKSVGLIQIEELGTIETPIILTNTLSVGTALNALVKYMIEQNEDIGITTGTVNCVVTECNDGRLNDIRGLHIKEEHVIEALISANEIFEEGSVGAGAGMCAFGLKGGIGSASRVISVNNENYIIGALVMSNNGRQEDLIVGDEYLGEKIKANINTDYSKDEGSIIIIIATNLPLSDRQLKRVANRAAIALGRTGSIMGNGSGDIAIAFSNGNIIKHYSDKNIIDIKQFYDEEIDVVFDASVEAVEEAIISSLYNSETTVGVRNNKYYGLKEFI